mmetsp:Transcript_104367/g.301914  ORF Transcript_104367/g.301914 Transcript_104367/m.301914 type:complete len:202 (+) Transcript_104367:79-684(+)
MSLRNAGKTLSQSASSPVFRPARTPLTLDFYAPHDGGRRSSYEIDISTHDAVGDCVKKRVYLKQGRLPKEFLSKEAIATGSAKALSKMPNASVTLCPRIRGMMRDIAESEGARQKVHDSDLVDEIRAKHKVDHVSGIFTDPRMPSDDVGTTHFAHIDFHRDPDTEKLDKTHFQKKTFYTDYTEAVIKNKGLGGKGPKVGNT